MSSRPNNDPHSARLALPEPDRLPPPPPLKWRLKTPEDVRKEDRAAKLNPSPPVLAGAGVAALLTAAAMPDVRSGWRGISLRQALIGYPVAFLVCFVAFYLLQLGINVRQYRKQKQVTICTRCYDIAPNHGNDKCHCGGELDDADRWTHERDG